MSHRRVIPRDLFCEGNLLTWLGRLALLEVDGMLPRGVSCHLEDPTLGFPVTQDPASGWLSVDTFRLRLADGTMWPVYRPYGTCERYTLILTHEDDDVLLLDIEGNPTEEFLQFCQEHGEKTEEA